MQTSHGFRLALYAVHYRSFLLQPFRAAASSVIDQGISLFRIGVSCECVVLLGRATTDVYRSWACCSIFACSPFGSPPLIVYTPVFRHLSKICTMLCGHRVRQESF